MKPIAVLNLALRLQESTDIAIVALGLDMEEEVVSRELKLVRVNTAIRDVDEEIGKRLAAVTGTIN